MQNIKVRKRTGELVLLDISKIRKHTQAACKGLKNVDFSELELDAKIQFRDGITTEEIQQTLIKTAVDKIDIDRPDWNFVAARLFLFDLYKKVTGKWGYNSLEEYFEKGEKEGRLLLGLKEKFNLKKLDKYIKPERDYQFTYIGIKTLYDRYIIKDKEEKPIELPQQLFMGVAMFLAQNETNPESMNYLLNLGYKVPTPEELKEKYKNEEELKKEVRTIWGKIFYDVISKFEVMMATPTLSNARTTRHQLSSCYLGSMSDSIEGIFDDYKEMALLSKFGGGIGWDFSKIRAMGSMIDNHKNASGGIIPWLKITNDIAIAVDQLGCVAKNSYVKVVKKVKTNNFVHDFRKEYQKYDFSEKELIQAIASYAENYAFEYGKFSKNFIRSLIFDYVTNTKGHKFLEKLYGLSHDQYKKIIGKYKKIKKGLPKGFEILKNNDNYAISKESIVINIHTLRPLKKIIDRKGYVRVAIGKQNYHLHLLLAKQFFENYNEKMIVDHIDGNKLNNKLYNLRIITNEENVSKSWDNEENNKKRIEKIKIRKFLTQGYSLKNNRKEKNNEFEILDIETEIIPITKVRIGDMILSYNIEEKKVEYKPVISKHKIDVKKKDQIKIEFENGNYIITSVWHPFPIIDKKDDIKYIRSDAIKIGDRTINEKNEKVKIINITKPKEKKEFFDISVKDNNNYFCSTGNKKGNFHLIHNTRKGAIAVYIEPWHMDIMDFLDLKKNSGEERRRAHDLFPALWIPDLFMKRIEQNAEWTLFDPYETGDLHDLYGEEFEKRYIEYENNPNIKKVKVNAKDLWKKILLEYYETGNPFLCFKDNANRRNPNNHNGIIRSSNLCVSGNTRLATQFGLVKAEELEKLNKEIIATYDYRTNGNRKEYGVGYAQCLKMYKTKTNAEVYKITTKDGYSIEATLWHEFYVVRNGKIIKIPLQEIKLTDKLLIQSGEGQFGKKGNYSLGLLTGFITGDGTLSRNHSNKQTAHIDLYNEDVNLKNIIFENLKISIKEYKTLKKTISTDETKLKIPKEFKHTKNSTKIRFSSVKLGRILEEKYNFTKKNKLRVPEFVFQGTKETVIGYLQGLFTSDASVNIIKNNGIPTLAIQLASISKNLLEEVQILLSNFGIRSKISKMRNGGKTHFEYKGKRYFSKPLYRLFINGHNAIKYVELVGFLGKKQIKAHNVLAKREKLGYNKYRRKNEYFEVEIKDIKYVGKKDVYDTTQLVNHSLIFNGIVTGNCTEIFQNTEPNKYLVEVFYEDGTKDYFEEEADVKVEIDGIETIIKGKKITSLHTINGKKVYFVQKTAIEGKTAVCNLASVNLSKVNTPRKIEKIIPLAIRMLDNVIDLNFYPVKKTKDTNLKNRAIGLGAMGEAQLIAEKQLFWGSEEHLKLIDELFERISYSAIEASANLAQEKGSYPEFKGSRWSKGILPIDTANKEAKKLINREYVKDWKALKKKVKKGMRNGYLMAIAPTSSISILSGTTQTIEPVYKRKWYEENLSGLIPVIVPNLSPDTYMFYTPAYELDQKVLVKAAAIRQKWIDQGQSLNIFINPEQASGKYLNEIYMLGWKLGIKSFYYLRSKSPEATEEIMDRSVECFGCQ